MKNKLLEPNLHAMLSGWLSPEGIFTPAVFGEYDEVARELEKANKIKPIYDDLISYRLIHGERLLELSGYIKFVYHQIGMHSCEAYVIFPQQLGLNKDVTDKQIDWIESNYHKMSSMQREFVNLYLQHNYFRKHMLARD